jgi:predicted transcriptional regulator
MKISNDYKRVVPKDVTIFTVQLKKLLDVYGIRQADICARASMNRSRLSNILNGKLKSISLHKLYNLETIIWEEIKEKQEKQGIEYIAARKVLHNDSANRRKTR